MAQILHRETGEVLFEAEGLTIRETLFEAYRKKVELHSTDLRGADLRGADLSGLNLSEAFLLAADLHEADLHEADLSKAILRVANLRGADLRGANLRGANLSGADLQGANLRETFLREAFLHSVNLSSVNLRGANLRGVNLSGANLSGVNLSGANLREANLRSANLREAYLRSANLRSANLSSVNLLGADLLGADLLGADLREADLREADLSGADLSGADLSGTIIKDIRFGIKKKNGEGQLYIAIPGKIELLDAERVTNAAGAVMEAIGFELKQINEPIIGSFFKELWFLIKKTFTPQQIEENIEKAKDALEAIYLDKPMAEAQSDISTSTAALIKSIEHLDEAVIRLARIILVKAVIDGKTVLLTTTITLDLGRLLDSNPTLLHDPAQMYKLLTSNSQERSLPSQPDVGMVE